MGNNINELASYMLPLAQELLAKAAAAGIDPVVIDTGRTPSEQSVKLAQGVSWTPYSKHEPQPPEQKSEAIDIAPREYLPMKLWNPSGAKWLLLGQIGKELGLHWGGDWPGTKRDPSHFEFVKLLPGTMEVT